MRDLNVRRRNHKNTSQFYLLIQGFGMASHNLLHDHSLFFVPDNVRYNVQRHLSSAIYVLNRKLVSVVFKVGSGNVIFELLQIYELFI